MKTNLTNSASKKAAYPNKNFLSFLFRYAPAGFPVSQETRIFLAALGISTLYSFGFLVRYLKARAELFEITFTRQKVLLPGAQMPPMTFLIHDAFAGFLLIGILAATGIICHYLFHRQGSKSIYLMRRLPNSMELHKRCLTLPLLGMVISLLAALLLFLLYYGIYQIFTPSVCLPNVSLSFLRNVIL